MLVQWGVGVCAGGLLTGNFRSPAVDDNMTVTAVEVARRERVLDISCW